MRAPITARRWPAAAARTHHPAPLLTHTSGVANYTGTQGLRSAIAADANHVFTPDELLAFVGPPLSAPGGETAYTNTAFLLLGLVAEPARNADPLGAISQNHRGTHAVATWGRRPVLDRRRPAQEDARDR